MLKHLQGPPTGVTASPGTYVENDVTRTTSPSSSSDPVPLQQTLLSCKPATATRPKPDHMSGIPKPGDAITKRHCTPHPLHLSIENPQGSAQTLPAGAAPRRLGPVDPLGQRGRPEVDQPGALDVAVLAVSEREPVNGLLGGLDDQHLIDAMGSIEGQLLPALVAGGDDLDNQRRGGEPGLAGDLAVQAAVGNAVVLFGFPEVDLSVGMPKG